MSKKILVVDDYEDARCFMKLWLERMGYQVIEATNGQEAVEIVQEELPDLVFMDMAMPVMNGLMATRLIKEFDFTAKIPIIGLTAFSDTFYEEALEIGCNELVTKPFDPNKLELIIEKYLSH